MKSFLENIKTKIDHYMSNFCKVARKIVFNNFFNVKQGLTFFFGPPLTKIGFVKKIKKYPKTKKNLKSKNMLK